jgi:hypothetical protein
MKTEKRLCNHEGRRSTGWRSKETKTCYCSKEQGHVGKHKHNSSLSQLCGDTISMSLETYPHVCKLERGHEGLHQCSHNERWSE